MRVLGIRQKQGNQFDPLPLYLSCHAHVHTTSSPKRSLRRGAGRTTAADLFSSHRLPHRPTLRRVRVLRHQRVLQPSNSPTSLSSGALNPRSRLPTTLLCRDPASATIHQYLHVPYRHHQVRSSGPHLSLCLWISQILK